MALVVLLGGARSGKSAFAQRLAEATDSDVVFIATAEAGDDEMADRIDAHQRSRPEAWELIEEPRHLRAALSGTDPASTVVVDCLTLWVANLIARGDTDSSVMNLATDAAAAAAVRSGTTIVVSNEVGMGVVPATGLGRRYRDLLGKVNQVWVDHSERAGLLVAGRVIPLLPDSGFFVAGRDV